MFITAKIRVLNYRIVALTMCKIGITSKFFRYYNKFTQVLFNYTQRKREKQVPKFTLHHKHMKILLKYSNIKKYYRKIS